MTAPFDDLDRLNIPYSAKVYMRRIGIHTVQYLKLLTPAQIRFRIPHIGPDLAAQTIKALRKVK